VNILFVLHRRIDAGSIHAVAGYQRAGDQCGHTVALFGAPDTRFPSLRMSLDVEMFDSVIFIFESTLNWLSGLGMSQLLNRVPRERRVILDADGMYNDVICVDDYDRNHVDNASRQRWSASYEALTDVVFQPTLHPLSSKVRPLLFYGFEPAAQQPHQRRAKSWDVLHLGHNWWRWRQIAGILLPAIARVRPHLRGICFVGSWWNEVPTWAPAMGLDEAFACDPDWMQSLDIQVAPPVPFVDVISTMSAGEINLMTQRPLFERLRLVTSKYFELLCADTIPLVMLPPDHVEEVYGPAGRELALCDDLEDKLLDVLRKPNHYRDVVTEVRRHLRVHHSYERRIEELVDALECELSRHEGRLAS
jgi:hypothetical protein